MSDLTDVADASSWIGRVIDGRYKIDRVLGQGGMGAVFVAEHLALAKPVALKIILPQLAGDAELAQRFAREAMVSAKLEHPHVASALDYGTLAEGGAYLVMQLARGRGLRAWLHGRADARIAVALGAQIADALGAAHAHGIVHRDLKPENVIVEERDGGLHARVLDFGIARVADAAKGDAPLTRLGTVMGTAGYMAPEQAVGEAVDARADVYALGVILWELVAGKTLFDQDDLGAIVMAQLTTTPPRLASIAREVPPPLDALVARMLDAKKSERPADGREVREALRTIGAAIGAPVRPPSGTFAAMGERAGADVGAARTSDTVHDAGNGAALGAGGSAAGERAGGYGSAPTEYARPAVGTASGPAPTAITGPSRPAMAPSQMLGLGVAAAVIAAVLLTCVVSRVACGGAPESAQTLEGTPETPSTVATTLTASPVFADAVPADLAPDLVVLETSPDDESRAAAAARLAAQQGMLPAYARAILAYETGRDCDDRRDAVRFMRTLGDPRSLAALHRIAATPRRSDRCLRRDLERAIDALTHGG